MDISRAGVIGFVGIAALAFFLSPGAAHAVQCPDIPADIGRGSSGASVLAYQNFLRSQGFLAATPNGYFGPSTFAATQAFQSARGISATGYVGPITRIAVRALACGQTSSVPEKPSASATSSVVSGSASAGAVRFSPRVSDQVLYIGDTYTVAWSAPAKSDLILVIEDIDGVNKGSLSGYLGAAQSYEWEVGTVSVSGSNAPKVLAPGRYRFRLQGRLDGKLETDAMSPYFSVEVPPIAISHMYPTTIVADGKTPGILYGTGFTAGITAYLDDSRDKALKLLYASPDAKLMVFVVPKGVPTGRYRMVLRNNFGSSFEGGMIQVTN